MQNKAELIFMKWKAELAEMDRSKPMVEGNFELLFDQMFRAKIRMNEALTFLEKAIKAHHPSDFLIKSVYKKMKKYPGNDSLENFEKSWKSLISDTAKRVFFAFFEIEGIEGASNQKINGMSKVERAKEQKYADSHETIDWEQIIKDQEVQAAQEEEIEELDIDLDKVNIDIDLGEL